MRVGGVGYIFLSLLSEICNYPPLSVCELLRDLPWQCRPHTVCFSVVTRNVLFLVPFHRPFTAHRAEQSQYHKPKITPTLRAVGAQLLSTGCVGAAEFPRQQCSQHAAHHHYKHLAKQRQREKLASEDRRHTAKGWQERDCTATLPANHLLGTSSLIRQPFKNRLL